MIDTYIIRMKGNAISEDLASELVASLEANDITHNFFDAIHGDQIEDCWQRQGLKFFHKLKPSRKLPGIKGCFLSHYMLWLKSFNENKPLLIFEHDAIVVKPISEKIIDLPYDVLNLDFASRVVENYHDYVKQDFGTSIHKWVPQPTTKGLSSKLNKASIKGLHAYIIKPQGAKRLTDYIRRTGVLPADIAVNSIACDLRYTKTCYAMVNPKYWIDAKNGSKHSFTRAKP